MQPSEIPKAAEPVPHMEGMGWRISLSIIVSIGWVVFLIIWLFFYAGQSGYNAYQNFAIVLASLLVLFALLGIPWTIWSRRFMKPEDREQWMRPGFRWRAWTSGIIAVATLIGLIIWFFVYANSYTIYQNIAIFIVALLIMGGVMGAMWAPWGMKYGKKQ
jgi:MFS family permease